MSTFTVTAGTPQGIFPFGVQDDFVITNSGLTTLYLDQDSSISLSSYVLPPLASMVWTGGKPLWALSGYLPTLLGQSTPGQISIALNNASIAPRPTQSIVPIIRGVSGNGGPSGLTLAICTDLEVGYLSSLSLAVNTGFPILSTTTTPYQLNVLWSKDAFQSSSVSTITETDVIEFWPTSAGTVSVDIPVKGAFCTIRLIAPSSADWDTVSLYGSTQEVDFRIKPFQSLGSVFPAFSLTVSASDEQSDFWSSNPWDGASVYLAPYYTDVTVSLRCTTSVTTAGTMALITSGGAWLERIDIPVVATGNSVITRTFVIPASQPVRLSCPTIPVLSGAGVMELSIRAKNALNLVR